MGGLGVDDVPIVGQPMTYGIGFLALTIVAFSRIVGAYFHTLAHEGGHALTAVATLRRVWRLRITDDTGGGTWSDKPRWGVGNLVVTFAGYAAPPLFGVAGAGLIAHGNVLGALLAVVVLATLALFITDTGPGDSGLATMISAMVVVGGGYAALAGSPELRAETAVGITWFLLLSGTVEAFRLPTDDGDAATLARKTWIPGLVWKLTWITIALVSLVVGAQLLLRPGYLYL